MGVPTKFEFLFLDFEVTYPHPPPFSRGLIVVVCLFFPNCSPFTRYRGCENFKRGEKMRV
jgi:hypothetical protein